MDNWNVAPEPDRAEYPNTVKRRRLSSARGDDMAGTGAAAGSAAAGDTSSFPRSPRAPSATSKSQATAGNESVGGDVNTCRICRGEGTHAEPLFYPCKCSGSIKFVHQDCLMEWLSHSQRKHCELCKTPFRFTKLYSPDMPKSLPFYVFASHVAKYLFRNVLVWLRAVLVISVWLGWLPWIMRSVWSFLFWISDEGLGPLPPYLLEGERNATAVHVDFVATTVASQGLTTTVCPSTPLLPATTTAANKLAIAQNMPKFLRALGQGVRLSNSSANLLVSGVSRILFGGPPSAAEQTQLIPLANVTQAGSHGTRHVQPSSLLGDVSFLKNLTRHARLNKTIIAVLEGQIITVLVIVCFILIILVRDYVVQQQPEINMRAAFAAQENNGHEGPVAVPPPDHFGPADEESETESETDDEDDTSVHDDESAIAHTGNVRRDTIMIDAETDVPSPAALPLEGPGVPPEPPRQRPIAGYRRRLVRRDTADGTDGTSSAAGTTPPPGQPAEPRDNQMQPGAQTPTVVSQYLRIYREADGDPERILRMIREEGLEERLASYVNATRAMPGATDEDESHGSPLQPPPRSTVSHNVPLEMPQVPTGQADMAADTKGKGKVTEDSQQAPEGQALSSQISQDPGASSAAHAPLFPSSASSSSARPRSVSDGPQHQGTINPLANGTWSFSNLPPQPHAGDDDVDTTSGSGQKTPSTTAASAGGSAVPENWDDAIPTDLHQEPHDDRPEDDGLWSDVDSTEPEVPHHEDAGEVADHIHEDAQPELVVHREPGGLVDRVADFMWGDVDAGDGDDGPGAIELFLDDGDAPFMEANRDADGLGEEDGVELAPDVVEAAAAAGIDPEALEDAEDFEGIMELVGMRGPIAGLVQNAIFCGFLVIITIFLGIFIPYNIGRLAVWVVANPARILQMILSFSKFVQDVLLLAVGWTTRCALEVVSATRVLFRVAEGRQLLETAAADARTLTTTSLNRIIDSFASDFPLISSNEVRNFSAISHQALIDVKGQIHALLSAAVSAVVFVLGGDYMAKWTTLASTATAVAPVAWETVKNIAANVARPSSWVISLNLSETASTIDASLAYWGAKDRTFAILGGYIAICVVAGLYLSRGTPFSSSPTGQEWEASIIDALNQASGVMKVILIISIEMLIFPLYCGLLLDFALLPLFETANFKSRLMFTYNFPLTSIFVHWFVGTGYMFHFALFVSMCRKIMRKGVLYFIRDPDDPEFHPVRDVLERNVTTQLRKILFSAFVYGALVVICLGGVVWGLSLALPNVLPIHYSSNEPVLEFPIDLLFYNFLMPLAVKFFKPSDGLHAMYTWWFRKCARTLRLTWFLFGERRIDEEGRLMLAPGAEDEPGYAWYRTVFLQVNKRNKVVPKTWADMFEAGQTKPVVQMNADELAGLNAIKTRLVDSGQLIPDGRFVRTPASDQVKIPKGQPVFLAVTERNSRMDGRPERPDSDLYTGPHYQFAYLPPHFRTRISLFILFIWLFAAVTGVGFTIVPLVFGRFMFKKLIPAHIRTNDIYAFSIGAYILGSLGYLVFHARSVAAKLQNWALTAAASLVGREGLDRIAALAVKTAKVGYTYTMLLVVFPLLTTLLMELYVLIPLHTWIHYTMMTMEPSPFPALAEGHTIRVIQAWTLGILYLKLGSRALLYQGGRPAQAVRAVLRRGWLDPDVGVLTRAFVLPGLVVASVMILSPPAVTRLFVTSWDYHGMGVVMFRMSYPLAAMMWAGAYLCRSLLYVLDGWHARVRDEAYLMGERLHNFGGLVGVGVKGANNRGEWRNGARL